MVRRPNGVAETSWEKQINPVRRITDFATLVLAILRIG